MELLKELWMLEEGDRGMTFSLQSLKPRGKHVNDTLRSKKSERHYNAKKDYVRAKEKAKASKMMEAEENCCYFHFDVSWEEKNRSGEGPEAFDKRDHGIIKADNRADAIAKVKKDYGQHSNVRVTEVTKAEYDKYMKD